MTTAIIGTGGIGSVIVRHLASGGEPLRLWSADKEPARTLAAKVGRAAVVAADNRDALRGVGATILALRFMVLKSVVDQRPPDRAYSRIRRHMAWPSGDLRRLRGWDSPVQGVRLSATMLSVDAESEDGVGRADWDWLARYAEYMVHEQSGQELPV